MSGRTRDREEPSSSSSSMGPPTQKRTVSRKTMEKWVVENDRDLNTSIWLKFKGDCDHVSSLRCAVCSQFNEKLISMCNYRPAFIEGTTNVRTAFREHAVTDMHAHAMVLFKKQHARDITEYSPIATALFHLRSMDETTQA